MRHLLILLIFILLPGISRSGEIDSLVSIIRELDDIYKKTEVLNDLCLKMVYTNPDSALIFGRQALTIGKSAKNDLITAKSFNRIGIVYDVKNIWDSAILFYDSALFYSIKVSDSITTASAYNNIGLVYWNKSHYDKAIENFIKSLRLFEKLGKKKGVANTYNNIGLILMEQERYSEAFYYQFNGLKFREEIGDEFGINDSRLNIALLYYSIENYDSSVFYYQNVIPYYLKENNHYALGSAYNGLAQVFEMQNKFDSALYYFDQAYTSHLIVDNNYKAASSLLNKSFVYNQMGDDANELKTLLLANDLAKDGGSEKVKSKILFQMAFLYHKMGNYKTASDLFLEFNSIRDSMYNLDRDEKIEQIKVQYEIEKKEKLISEQQAANERLEKDKALAELKTNNRNIWIIIIISLNVSIIFIVLSITQRKRRKVQAEKDASIILEREKGLKAIFEAQEDERKRIAKDLHDGIGQQISAIKLYFQGLTKGIAELKPSLSRQIETIDKMISETASEVRTISHQMMPKALTELGLAEAIEDVIDKSFSQSEIKCRFEHHNLGTRLPQNIEIGLYRIAQELLNNIMKHSGARNVEVQLMRIENYCILIIQDDGKGMFANDKSHGIGFMNINNRLRTINGEINMESQLNQGTTATIKIALNE